MFRLVVVGRPAGVRAAAGHEHVDGIHTGLLYAAGAALLAAITVAVLLSSGGPHSRQAAGHHQAEHDQAEHGQLERAPATR